MANLVIGNYTSASTIDGTTHFLLIQPGNSSTAYNKINRNVLLGVTGQPMDVSTSQTVSNKVLNNTNSATLQDTLFTLQDNSDNTKQAQFQLSGITTGTTRTYTLPDASSTIALLSTNNTFTGTNSFTGSTWTGGTISNATIQSNTVQGFTTSNTGNIYGIAVTSGVITGANTIGNAALQTNAVQGNQLANNAITLGYAPSTSNITPLSATTTTEIVQFANTVTVPAGSRKIKVTWMASITPGAGIAPVFSIWRGAVGSGTQIQLMSQVMATASNPYIVCLVGVDTTVTSGSTTYRIGYSVPSSSISVNGGTGAPSFSLVEAI